LRGNVTTENLTLFINEFNENKLEEYFKTSKEPLNNSQTVKIIVGKTF